MLKIFRNIFCIAIICSIFLAPIFAQSGRVYRGLIISPVNAILDANRGDNLNGSIRFTNDTELDQSVNIKVVVKDFKLTEDYTINDSVSYPPAASLAAWINTGKTSFVAKKGITVEIPYSVKIPLNADYGGHYATITFVKDQDIVSAGQLSLITRLQFPILLNINGNRIEKLDIDKYKTDKDLYETADINFTTNIKNIGNVHLLPRGDIKITGGWIGSGSDLTFNPDSAQNAGYVLPDKDISKKYENNWKDDSFKIGPYSATLTMFYDTLSGPASITSTVQFWIIPWKLILSIIGVIILIILIIVVFKKFKKRKSGKKKII